jgi:hypothetical protein
MIIRPYDMLIHTFHIRSTRQNVFWALWPKNKSDLPKAKLTPGQEHESTVFQDLMDQGAVKRNGRGRPKKRPGRVAGDKAYGSGKIRTFLRKRGIRSTIPRKSNEKRAANYRAMWLIGIILLWL